jgi:hypothetical protein
MSTKTTFKRIALVAVAALGAGVLSVAPANAATTAITTSVPTVGTAESNVVLGATATSTVGFTTGAIAASADDQTYTNTTVTLVVPTGSAVTLADRDGAGAGTTAAFSNAAGATANLIAAVNATSGAVTGDAATADVAAGAVVAGTVSVIPDVAGTYKIVVTSGAGTTATSTIYAANLWGEVADGVSNGDQSDLTINGVAGAYNQVTLSFQTTASASRLITVTGSTINAFATGTNATAVISADKTSMVVTDDATAEAVTFSVFTPTAGTITVRAFSASQGGIYGTTAYGTVVITVNAASITGGIDAATSTSVVKAGSTWAAGTSATTDGVVVASRTASLTPAAVVKVALGQVSGAITTTTAVTASISGPGTLVLNDDNDHTTSAISTGRSISSTVAATTETFYVLVQPDGNSGVATITVTAGGFTSTETLTFHGSVASYVLTTKNAVLSVGSTADTQVLTVAALDSAGIAIPSATVYVSSGTTSIATVDAGTVTTSATGVAADIGVNGVAKGSAVITVGNAASAPTVSATATISVVAAGISSVALSFDKAEYTSGEKATITITAKNADGALVGDEAYATLFATGGITTSSSLTTDLSAVSVTTVNGVKTYSVFMPLAAGPVTISATLGASVATAIQATVVTASATVASDGAAQAAADAAAEATDAANAATDAANAAAEAADAATAAAQDAADAVAALSTQVAEMVDALKKQITALTNLVIKIQKKVKA